MASYRFVANRILFLLFTGCVPYAHAYFDSRCGRVLVQRRKRAALVTLTWLGFLDKGSTSLGTTAAGKEGVLGQIIFSFFGCKENARLRVALAAPECPCACTQKVVQLALHKLNLDHDTKLKQALFAIRDTSKCMETKTTNKAVDRGCCVLLM